MNVRALSRIVKACLGNARAQYELALLAAHDPPDRPRLRLAKFWAERAMRNGDPAAFQLIAVILGKMGNPSDAIDYMVATWRSAAERGDAVAQFSLGCCYEMGGDWGVPKDLEKALFWYTKAAIGGYADAQSAVARLCSSGQGTAGSTSS